LECPTVETSTCRYGHGTCPASVQHSRWRGRPCVTGCLTLIPVAYAGMAALLKLGELRWIVSMVRQRLGR
jgi:hypothetical protein